jgi:tetratricopeptide (TPR) repeat protein
MAWWKFWEREASGRRVTDYYEEGVALVRQERHHDALTSFRLALRQRPDDAATLEQMAVVYTHIGLPDEAVKSYQRALELRPTSTSAHYGLAFLLLKAGHTEAAVVHLEAFLRRAKSDRDDPRQMEHARRTLGRVTGAGPPATDGPGTDTTPANDPGPGMPGEDGLGAADPGPDGSGPDGSGPGDAGADRPGADTPPAG